MRAVDRGEYSRCAEAGAVRGRKEGSGDYERNRGCGPVAEEIIKAIDERWPAGNCAVAGLNLEASGRPAAANGGKCHRCESELRLVPCCSAPHNHLPRRSCRRTAH